MWFYALNLYLIQINDNSLLMTTINGLSVAIVFILFAGSIGSLIDKYQRIEIIRAALLIQNLLVFLNCTIVICIIILKEYFTSLAHEGLIYCLQILIIFLNCLSTLSSMIVQVSLERDWSIVIANEIITKKGKQGKIALSEELAEVNSKAKRFDIMTSMLTPLFISFIISVKNGILISASVIALWNAITYFIELRLLKSINASIPLLHKDQSLNTHKTKYLQLFKKVLAIHKGYLVYFKLGFLSIGGLSLAVLYMTILNFDSLTVDFSKGQNLGTSAINLLRAISGLTGIIGTIIFPILHNRCKLDLKITGLSGLVFQFICSLVCLISLWIPDSPFVLYSKRTYFAAIDYNITYSSTTMSNKFFPSSTQNYTSVLMLLIGMGISRFGFWLFNLSINQIMQESIVEKYRGLIGGIQNALIRIFDIIKLVLIFYLNDLTQFGYLVILSVCFGFLALGLFLIFVGSSSLLKNNQNLSKNRRNNEETVM
jgi:solute carrier family 40 (iron-regulated transporter), member 1